MGVVHVKSYNRSPPKSTVKHKSKSVYTVAKLKSMKFSEVREIPYADYAKWKKYHPIRKLSEDERKEIKRKTRKLSDHEKFLYRADRET